MRASPPDGRRPRERCCATTLLINTGLWISRWSPSWASAAGGLTVHALCWIECLPGVRSSYPHRAFQGTGQRDVSHPPPAQRAGRPPYHRCTAASSASRSDTRSFASAVPVGGRLEEERTAKFRTARPLAACGQRVTRWVLRSVGCELLVGVQVH